MGLLFWVFRAIIGGIFYALAAFITKQTLEKWKSKCKNYFRKSDIAKSKKTD